MESNLTPDEVLEKVGGFGRYQLRLLMVMGFMKTFGDGFQAMITSFIAAEPPWMCVSNSSVCNMTGSFSPGQNGYKLRCEFPRNAWEFDTKEFTSIVAEWDLVCDRSSLKDLSKSVVFAGYMVGVLLGGVLSDKFGRKPIVYFPSVLCNVLGLAASFVINFETFIVLRGLVGVCIGSSSLSMFILIVEYVSIKHRAKAGISTWYFFTLSLMLLALWGYLIRDWRMLSIAGAVPGLLQVFFWWFLPESSRWLVVQQKETQARECFTKIAKVNRKEMPSNPVVIVEEKQRLGDVRDLFRTWKMTRITLLSWLCWATNALIYYGVLFSAGNYGGNRYLVFFLVSIVELPSNYTAIKLMDRFGRKKTLLVGLIIAALAALGAVLLQRDSSNTGFLVGNIIMAMTAKFFINMSFGVIYIFSAELFPTVIRNVGMGTSSAAGRIGSISAPFVAGLVRIHVLLPYSIYAITAFITGILSLTLPETRNEPTPEIFQKTEEQQPEDVKLKSSSKLLDSKI